MPATPPPLSFPPLFGVDIERWQWPPPPIAWRHEPAPEVDVAQPCRLETAAGEVGEGEMLGFDAPGRSLQFRSAAGGQPVTVRFDQFLRLTLLSPLQPVIGSDGRPLSALPVPDHECDYVLHPKGGGRPLAGRTVSRVPTPEGLFLYEPVEEESVLLRVFAPQVSTARCDFGPTTLELTVAQWADTPAKLVQAAAHQRHKPVAPLGQSLLALALLTPRQLERALPRKPESVPLGEFLVSGGLISRAELQAAIAHKMGCPVADVSRFPIDPDAVSRLPQRLALSYRILPLMIDGNRLFIASDELPSEDKQRSIQVFTNLAVVPVLARRADLRAALEGIPGNAWSARLI